MSGFFSDDQFPFGKAPDDFVDDFIERFAKRPVMTWECIRCHKENTRGTSFCGCGAPKAWCVKP